jgi:hypothetical protein
VTRSDDSSAWFGYVGGCVIDKATRSLLMVENGFYRLVRLRGIDI